MTGTVKWFRRQRGFGIIDGEDGNEYFAHYSNIIREDGGFRCLYGKEEVSFRPVEEESGKRHAEEICVTKEAPIRADVEKSFAEKEEDNTR